MIYIYQIYGLSFFILWAVLWVYHIKIVRFPLGRNLWMIAVFAVCHGMSDWINMLFFVKQIESDIFRIAGLVLLAASFYFLIWFGVRGIAVKHTKHLVDLAPLLLFTPVILITALSSNKFLMGEVFSRYLLGVPGALFTYYSLAVQIPEIKINYPEIARDLRSASIAFIFYAGFTGLVVPEAGFFPASVFNYSTFIHATGLPVELFRAVSVLWITYALSRVLHKFELEAENSMIKTREELEEMVKERTAALAELNETLKERDRRQRAILDSIPDIAWLKDRESRFIAVNEAFAGVSNKRPEDLIGKTDLDIWPRDLAERYRADDREVMEAGRRKQVEEPLADEYGNLRWIETIKTPLYDEKGRIAGTTGIARDITDRKRMETALKESEGRYRVIAENAQDAIITIDEDDRILVVNEAAEKIFGYTSTEMHGLPFTMLMPERFREAHLRAVKGHIAAGAKQLPLRTVELPGLHRDGREIPLEISFGESMQGGKHVFIGILRNITERKLAEEALRSREKELSNITANLAEGIYVLGEKGNIMFMNPEAERLLGWTAEELKDKNPHELVHFRKADGTPLPFEECNMIRVLKTGERFSSTDEVFVRKDGTVFPISVISAPIIEGGKVIASITAFQDITGLKRAEEKIKNLNRDLQRRASELEIAYRDMESFSYAVSHDLKAPTIRIEGFSNILLEDYADKLDQYGKDLLGRMRENSNHMKRLIEDLLAFFRFGNKRMEKSQIDMGVLAKSIYEELKADIGERKLQFEIKDPPAAYGDPAMIHQVLLNLIANSVKFTRTKEAAVIEVGGLTENNENIYFVKDNGIGFDMQFSNKLFGLFQRIHISKEFEGTGVGLVIVKKIVENHGGRVWAEGVPDQGATFYFSLPGNSE